MLTIDTGIVDAFLRDGTLGAVCGHWIYRAIVPGQTLIAEPETADRDALLALRDDILELLTHFEPYNAPLWGAFLAKGLCRPG